MTQRIVVCVECKTEYKIPRTQKRLKSYENCGNDDCNCRKFRAKKRKCAKCRDRKRWSTREEYRGGILALVPLGRSDYRAGEEVHEG